MQPPAARHRRNADRRHTGQPHVGDEVRRRDPHASVSVKRRAARPTARHRAGSVFPLSHRELPLATLSTTTIKEACSCDPDCLGALALVCTLAAAYRPLLRRPILTWGATGEEATCALPGDELLEPANGVSTRAITIDAPASAVWPLARANGARSAWWRLHLRLDRESPWPGHAQRRPCAVRVSGAEAPVTRSASVANRMRLEQLDPRG